MGSHLRNLFVIILIYGDVAVPLSLWNQHRDDLSADILYLQHLNRNDPGLVLSDNELYNHSLYEIENLLNRQGHSLRTYPGMPYPDLTTLILEENSLIIQELNYNHEFLRQEHSRLVEGLNGGQHLVYSTVVNTISAWKCGFFFVYGSGGTGKTYLWNTLLARIRSEKKIAIFIASSGIAALLLPGGHTAHSRFKIPINLTRESLCDVRLSTPLAELLGKVSLIIWDEEPMTHRFAFEALDHSLHDVMRVSDSSAASKIFGSKIIVFGGDFRHILPVINRESRADIVSVVICSSIWSQYQVFMFTENMRLRNSELEDVTSYQQWTLDLGEGRLHVQRLDDDEEEPSWIVIPKKFIGSVGEDLLDDLIRSTYPFLEFHYHDKKNLQSRAILAPKNDTVDEVNNIICRMIPDDARTYLSADRISPNSENIDSHTLLYPVEYLNSLKFSGLSNQQLEIKVGMPVILLRNINQKCGLFNGTRLVITKLGDRVVEAEILCGSFTGNRYFIPHIEMISSDTQLHFQLARRQFPLRPCYAMTINKSQGQTFKNVGVYLPEPAFGHGQFYVEASRVISSEGFKVFLHRRGSTNLWLIKNIIYSEVFDKLNIH